MTPDKIITVKYTAQVSASIISANPTTDLSNPMWAINWFDLRKPWLYERYNQLAFGQLRQHGASPVFKGKLTSTLLKNDRLRRDMLLIVQHRNAQGFLDLLASPFFQLKSKLRNASIKYFQFGFMQKENEEDIVPHSLRYTGRLKYLVHVCESRQELDLQSLLALAASFEIFPHFIGHRSALLGFQKGRGQLKTMDFILSHVFVFSGFDEHAIHAFVYSDEYQKFTQTCSSNFIGIYNRLI
ncbi:hypothetical protein N7E81_11455 [Reichenbachiella carrageenanivorans]|uniref:Uncharacterized protein n=1 Tax=Reichenbachiella carrageenanivorans TaxID=2979869 RepID=A0ABY6CVP1_9BACT|nr:hypothetical protein [Reichenbachiella carrageenanivorans]UXX77977.1 hypothetical protein N7E81_11455 [Reichenbachiella carrageenanivorans]